MSWTRKCILSAQERDREAADPFPRQKARVSCFVVSHHTSGFSPVLLPRLCIVSAFGQPRRLDRRRLVVLKCAHTAPACLLFGIGNRPPVGAAGGVDP